MDESKRGRIPVCWHALLFRSRTRLLTSMASISDPVSAFLTLVVYARRGRRFCFYAIYMEVFHEFWWFLLKTIQNKKKTSRTGCSLPRLFLILFLSCQICAIVKEAEWSNAADSEKTSQNQLTRCIYGRRKHDWSAKKKRQGFLCEATQENLPFLLLLNSVYANRPVWIVPSIFGFFHGENPRHHLGNPFTVGQM